MTQPFFNVRTVVSLIAVDDIGNSSHATTPLIPEK
jgi:hypothetical protein